MLSGRVSPPPCDHPHLPNGISVNGLMDGFPFDDQGNFSTNIDYGLRLPASVTFEIAELVYSSGIVDSAPAEDWAHRRPRFATERFRRPGPRPAGVRPRGGFRGGAARGSMADHG